MSWKKENKIVIVLLLALVILVPTASYVGYQYAVYGGGAITGITYGPGDVDSASYIIFKEGSTYYAKNGTTRAIDYSGSVATTVINNAIQATNRGSYEGGTILLRAGNYTISSTINLISHVTLEGEEWATTYLTLTADTNLLSAVGSVGSHWQIISLKNLYLDGNGHSGDAIHFEFANVVDIDNVIVEAFDGSALVLYEVWDGSVNMFKVDSCGSIASSKSAINITARSVENTVDVFFSKVWLALWEYQGIFIGYGAYNTFTSIFAEGNQAPFNSYPALFLNDTAYHNLFQQTDFAYVSNKQTLIRFGGDMNTLENSGIRGTVANSANLTITGVANRAIILGNRFNYATYTNESAVAVIQHNVGL